MNSPLHLVDAMLQKQFPSVMVPTKSHLEPIESIGHRFLIAGNGVWVEVKRPWLRAVVQVAPNATFAMPYGTVQPALSILPLPEELVRNFQEYAKTQLPNECAAQIIYCAATAQLRMEILAPSSVSDGHVEFPLAPLRPEEHLVLDIHSHGYHQVYFSKTDNEDDKGGFYIAGVIGFSKDLNDNDQPECNGTFRLCMNSMFSPLTVRRDNGHFHFSLGD